MSRLRKHAVLLLLLLAACDMREARQDSTPPANATTSTARDSASVETDARVKDESPADLQDSTLEAPVVQSWSNLLVPSHLKLTGEEWLAWRTQARERRLALEPETQDPPTDYSKLAKLSFVEPILADAQTIPYLRFEFAWESQEELSARMTALDWQNPQEPVLPRWAGARANRDGTAGIPQPPERKQRYYLHVTLKDELCWWPYPLPGPSHPGRIGHFIFEFGPVQEPEDGSTRAMGARCMLIWWE